MHSFYVYIQSLTTASGSRLFGSVVTALDFCPGDHGSNPARVVKFSAMLFPLLPLSCRKMGAHPGLDLIRQNLAFASS